MITALDHIAIAVPDLEGAIARFLEDFGLQHDGNEVVEAAQTTTAFFSVPETHIELVHPLTAPGPLQRISRSEAAGCITCVSEPMTLTPMSRGCVTRATSSPAMRRHPVRTAHASFLSIPKVVMVG